MFKNEVNTLKGLKALYIYEITEEGIRKISSSLYRKETEIEEYIRNAEKAGFTYNLVMNGKTVKTNDKRFCC